MTELNDYQNDQKPAWCPGCGNFQILKTVKETLAEQDLSPHEVLLVSGIGQAAKLPHYLRCHTFNGLHGRALPVATGARLANHRMLTITVAGDGDCYGEGGNHLLNAMRRNINVKLFVHNNQVYGLTKGQGSPTTREGLVTKTQPFGILSEQLSPLALAVAMDASWVARSFAGDQEHLKAMMKEAINHEGFAMLDILQPCVTFNKINTFKWYKERVTPVGEDHDPTNRTAAFEKALMWGDEIPVGVIYKNPERKTMESRIPFLEKESLNQQAFDPGRAEELLEEFL